MTSTRLPGKVLMDIAGRPALRLQLDRLAHSRELDEVVIATSTDPSDDAVADFAREHGVRLSRGPLHDVLERYRHAGEELGCDAVVRITGDCPLIDPVLVDRTVSLYAEGGYDYVGLATGAGAARLDGGRFPTGFDAECFSTGALEKAWREAVEPSDREHVTPYLWRTGLFRTARLRGERDLAHYRCSVDTPEDLRLVRAVVAELGADCSFDDVIALLDARPELAGLNAEHVGREGHDEIWSPGTRWAA